MNKPAELDPLAEALLGKLEGKSEMDQIVLGGYFALKHYLDYRQTHDVDAWWKSRPTATCEQVIEGAMRTLAAEKGLSYEKRRFGDTVSFELLSGSKRVFSFQIASRSVELEPPLVSPWPPILIETLADNVGAKMNALVERGAARDLVDIFRIVTGELMTTEQVWGLWVRKNPGSNVLAAKDNVRLHLSALEARRPLSRIADAADREHAAEVRRWFNQEFLAS